MTTKAAYDLRANLIENGVSLDKIDAAIHVEDLVINLMCMEHGALAPLHPVCAHPDHPGGKQRVQRVVVNHSVLDEIERDGPDTATIAIRLSRTDPGEPNAGR